MALVSGKLAPLLAGEPGQIQYGHIDLLLQAGDQRRGIGCCGLLVELGQLAGALAQGGIDAPALAAQHLLECLGFDAAALLEQG